MSRHVADRLQPALLDRLTDDDREHHTEPEHARVMSRARLREAVLRDLSWLFNAVCAAPAAATAAGAGGGPRATPVDDSVLGFGLPPLAGQLASRLDVSRLERVIRDAILRFEPRILPGSLQVNAIETLDVLETHNVVAFEIRGHLWSQPVPQEILLRTRVDLEAGQVELQDALGRARDASLPSHPTA